MRLLGTANRTAARIKAMIKCLTGKCPAPLANVTSMKPQYGDQQPDGSSVGNRHDELDDMPSSTNTNHDGRYYTESEIGSVANAKGASLVGIEDAGGHLAATDVEAAIAEIIEGTNILDHGKLDGRGDDDHSGYPWSDGRSGGQTLYGGTDASDDLTLESTSHGTRGDVNINNNIRVHGNGDVDLGGSLSGSDPMMLLDYTNELIELRDSGGLDYAIFRLGTSGTTTFNAQGRDIDFRISGASETDLFFVDASTDRIGVGTDTPVTEFTAEGVISTREQNLGVPATIANYGQWLNDSNDKRFKGVDGSGNVHELGILDGEVFLGGDLAEDPEGDLRWAYASPGYLMQTGVAVVTAAQVYAFTFGASYGCTNAHGRWDWTAQRIVEPENRYEQAEVSIGVPTKIWGKKATIRVRVKVNDVNYLDHFYIWWNDVGNTNAIVTRGRTDILGSMTSNQWYEAEWEITLPTVGSNGGFRFGIWPVGRDIGLMEVPVEEAIEVYLEYMAIRQWAV